MAKSIEEVKEKLKKLYAMMDTDKGACQSEVESAMKAASKLMAEYKLSEKDFMDKNMSVIQRMLNIKYSSITNPWIYDLNAVIAENYCCHPTMYNMAYSKLKYAGMMGFEDDLDIAEKTMEYATECILEDGKGIKKRMLKQGYSNKEITSAINAYGNGYVRGIMDAFAEQNKTEDESFALVMTVNQDITNEVKTLKKSKFNADSATQKARSFDRLAYAGYMEGKRFNMASRLAG